MKIARSELYRVKVGAIVELNRQKTLCETEPMGEYFCVAVRNAHRKIIAFKEIKTGKELVKRSYYKNECDDNDYEDEFYPYAFDKAREVMQFGDVDIKLDQKFSNEELNAYMQRDAKEIGEALDNIQIRAIEIACLGYDESCPMDYYNQKLYICYLDDDFIIVKPKKILGVNIGYSEIVTGRKVIKTEGDEYNEFNYMINLNRELMSPEIASIDRSCLATRELEVGEVTSYMNLTAEEVEAKISNYLAKKSRERILNFEPMSK